MGMKYICECCQSVFDEEELELKMEQETGWKYVECPVCGEDNTMVEAVRCSKCGDWINKDEAVDSLCEDCARELVSSADEEYLRDYIAERCFDDFVDMLISRFTESTIIKALMSNFEDEARDFIEDELEDFVKWYNKNV